MPDTSNKFTQAVDYIADYLKTTNPLLTDGEIAFPDIETKLQFCIKMLKSNAFYEGDVPK